MTGSITIQYVEYFGTGPGQKPDLVKDTNGCPVYIFPVSTPVSSLRDYASSDFWPIRTWMLWSNKIVRTIHDVDLLLSIFKNNFKLHGVLNHRVTHTENRTVQRNHWIDPMWSFYLHSNGFFSFSWLTSVPVISFHLNSSTLKSDLIYFYAEKLLSIWANFILWRKERRTL